MPSTNVDDRFHRKAEEYNKYTENAISKAEKEKKLTKDDASLIRMFLEYKALSVGPGRITRIATSLIIWRVHLKKTFKAAKITDIYKAHNSIKIAESGRDGGQYKQNTLRDLVIFLKMFYQWLIEDGYSKIDIKKINEIQRPATDTLTKTRSEILTVDEIEAIIKNCANSRDRAIFSLMYEAGLRSIEIGRLTWRQIDFQPKVCTITVNEKTNKVRYIPIVVYKAYLSQWRTDCPWSDKQDDYVFKTRNGEQLQYHGLAYNLKAIAEKAGIKKSVSLHGLRHARVTHMLTHGWSETSIKKLCWGSSSTGMLATYEHLGAIDMQNEALKHAGVMVDDGTNKGKRLEAMICPVCDLNNAPDSKYCRSCGTPLTVAVVDKLIIAERQAELRPQYKALLSEFEAKLLQMQQKE